VLYTRQFRRESNGVARSPPGWHSAEAEEDLEPALFVLLVRPREPDPDGLADSIGMACKVPAVLIRMIRYSRPHSHIMQYMHVCMSTGRMRTLSRWATYACHSRCMLHAIAGVDGGASRSSTLLQEAQQLATSSGSTGSITERYNSRIACACDECFASRVTVMDVSDLQWDAGAHWRR
jgi:hypothetical protein